jgi:UDP-glucose 4-epimerase
MKIDPVPGVILILFKSRFKSSRIFSKFIKQNLILMKFIISGGAGFIGSHLAESLIKEGKQVVVIDNLSTGSLRNLQKIRNHAHFVFIENDVCSIQDWDSILTAGDVIIHLAATVGVNKVMVDALDTFENNLQPTITLLKQAHRFHCKLLLASTSEVYGELKEKCSSELDSLVIPNTFCGRSAYILGKINSEFYCLNYARQFDVPVIVARFFNVIGANQTDKHGMVVPTFINQALAGEPITVYGNGDQTRSFCNIRDLVEAIKQLVSIQKAHGEIFNIGSDQTVTIEALAQYIKEATHSVSKIVHTLFPEQRIDGRDIKHRCAFISKIKSFTGWQPVISWQESIDEIIAVKCRASLA